MLLVFVFTVGCGTAQVESRAESSNAPQAVAQGPARAGNKQPAKAAPSTDTVQAAQKPAATPQSKPAVDVVSHDGADREPATKGKTAAQAPNSPADQGGKLAVSAPDTDAKKVTAVVEPACVRAGGTVTITVTTDPEASVAYQAFYADGQGGGPPPWGAGYGGNDGDLADGYGRYTDQWTVAANAPAGPGHVDVVATASGGFEEISVPFAVSDAVTGSCDR